MKKYLFIYIFTIVVVLICEHNVYSEEWSKNGGSSSSDSSNICELSQILFGSTINSFVIDSFAYICSGHSLFILNISNKERPILIGQLDTKADVKEVEVKESVAYLANDTNGLLLVDVSNPNSPNITKIFPTISNANNLIIKDSLLFLSDRDYGLRILNIASPDSIYEIGHFVYFYAADMFVLENYAYLTNEGFVVRIVDISDPSAPTLASTYNIGGYVRDICAIESLAFVLDYTNGITILNVSDASSPSIISIIDSVGSPQSIQADSNFIYIADGHAGFCIYDYSDLTNVHRKGSYYNGFCYYVDVCVKDSFAFISDELTGLIVFDITDVTSPSKKGSYDTYAVIWDIILDDTIAVLSGGEGGVRIVDISCADEPKIISYLNTPGWLFQSALKDGILYCVSSESGLQVINVTDYSKPSLITIGGVMYPSAICIDGNFAYIADNMLGGFEVCRIYSPTNIQTFSQYVLPSSVLFLRSIKKSKDYVYFAAEEYGLRIVDVSDSLNPVEVGLFKPLGNVNSSFINGEYAYLACDTQGLIIIDISEPNLPKFIGRCDSDIAAVGISVNGNYALLSEETGGLRVINVTNPAAPYELGYYDTPVRSVNAVQRDGVIYVADNESGLWILDYYGSDVGIENIVNKNKCRQINYVKIKYLDDGIEAIFCVSKESKCDINLYDISGRKVMNLIKGLYEGPIIINNFSHKLPKGNYIMKGNLGETEINSKLVKFY